MLYWQRVTCCRSLAQLTEGQSESRGWHVACPIAAVPETILEDLNVRNKLLIGVAVSILGGAAGCTPADNVNVNANANATVAATTTRTAADGSEITTTTDASGIKTETRVFRNNPRVSRVVVTTNRDGRRTVRAYSATGQDKEVNDVGDALEVTGDKIADAAGWVAGKTKDGVVVAGDKLEDLGDKTASGAKKVGRKTVEGAKTVGEKTAEGAKKAGSAIKKAVTP